MFDIKCINCKFFNPSDGCEKGLEDENCNAFTQTENDSANGQVPRCENCVWSSNGFCDFDFTDPNSCRRFKNAKDGDCF